MPGWDPGRRALDGTIGSDRLISLTRTDEGRRYFSLDGLRSVVNLTDDDGLEVASYHLDAWGNFRFPDELNDSKNRFAFTGHIYDTETGLYNAKARYFDPKLGRFLTQDSFLGQIDEPPSLHRYAYARNQPTLYVDPDGHIAIVDNLVGGVASVAIGWGMSKLTGQEYSWKDAAVDFGLGVATSGLSSLTKLKHASKLVQWGTRAATETALDAGAEVARKEWKGEQYTAGDIATGAAANLAIGEAGAAVGRRVGKWWRNFRQGDEVVEQAAKSADSPNLSQGQKTAVIEESARGRGDAPSAGEKLDPPARPAGNSAAPPPPDVARGPSPNVAAAASARHAAWATDVPAIGATMARLGKRALRESDGNWVKSEQLFERYLKGVESRLQRTGSRYGVEIQPAALPGGERVDNFIWHEKLDGSGLVHNRWGNLALFPYPGSRRLDAALVDRQSAGRLKEVTLGFDITLNKKKPDKSLYYEEAFTSMRRFYDLRPGK